MASIDVNATGGTDGTSYTVEWEVTAATGMPSEIFLVKFSNNEFVGVIVPDDLTFPTTRTGGVAHYRQSTVTGTYDTLEAAQEARTVIDANIQLLVDAYNAQLTTFLTTTSTSYT